MVLHTQRKKDFANLLRRFRFESLPERLFQSGRFELERSGNYKYQKDEHDVNKY